MTRKLLLLNGMTPGGRVFRKLCPLLSDYEVVDWIDPGDAVSVADYARRLVDEMQLDSPCDVLGVSFGGIVAQELAPLIGAELCLVVSSVTSPSELSDIGRLLGIIPDSLQGLMLNSVGRSADFWPSQPSAETVRARKFTGSDGRWFRWATAAVLGWRPKPNASDHSVVRIHGDRDKTFPRGHEFADHVIGGASHLLAVSHAQDLADIVTEHRDRLERTQGGNC